MLKIAAARCHKRRGSRWLKAEVQTLPASLHGYADLVVCSSVITFISEAACRRAMKSVVRGARLHRGWLLIILPALESHDAVVALETQRPSPPRAGKTAIVRRDDRMQRFYTREGARQLALQAGLRSVQVRKVWYPWIDEGVTRAPRSRELPWDWAAHRPAVNSIPTHYRGKGGHS